MKLFKDRIIAGKLLAEKLRHYQNKNVIVLALPRGGVPVGFQIAQALNVPLDVFLVRKLGFPGQEELAMGAIASGGIVIFNQNILTMSPVSTTMIESIKEKELSVLKHRETLYRGNKPFPSLKNKIVILIDDGIATGATIRAAIAAIKKMLPKKIVIATPVAPPETIESLKNQVEEVICLETPEPFYAIGLWYENFPQTADEEVKDLLRQAKQFGKNNYSK